MSPMTSESHSGTTQVVRSDLIPLENERLFRSWLPNASRLDILHKHPAALQLRVAFAEAESRPGECA